MLSSGAVRLSEVLFALGCRDSTELSVDDLTLSTLQKKIPSHIPVFTVVGCTEDSQLGKEKMKKKKDERNNNNNNNNNNNRVYKYR